MMRILGHDLLFQAAVRAGPLLIRLLGRTWRIRWIGEEHLEACRRRREPVLLASWHGRLLPLIYTLRNRRIQILISRHRDGEMLRRVTERLGFGSVRGSTGKRGAQAILQMARRAAGGFDLAITPDGPRGPREKAQAGVVRIAQRAGIPVLPLTGASSRGWSLRSWDRFHIPAPFARVVVGYGPPIDVPPTLAAGEVEAVRLRIERAITALREEADGIARRRENG